ncbi:CHASE2 domain-containing protein [Microcystis aeruginosa]|nr:CHASE2 domain-containing protein [Microcystis aeruginosa]
MVVVPLAVILEAILPVRLLQKWELKAIDGLMRLRPPEKPDQRLLIVEATENDLQKYGYPISNDKLTELIEKLEQYQPKVIGVNILREQELKNRHNLIYTCNHRLGNDPNSPGNPPPQGVPKEYIGFSDVIEDSDGVVRRHLLFMKPEATSPCQTPLSFSFQLAAYYLNTQGIEPETTLEGYTKLDKTILKKLTANTWKSKLLTWTNVLEFVTTPLNSSTGVYGNEDLRGYQLLLNYRSNQEQEIAPKVTLQSVLENQVSPDAIKDKIVIIGNTSPNQSSYWSTPYSEGRDRKIPGVLLQAQMVSQIISAVLANRPLLSFLPKWAEIILIWSWILVGALIGWIFYGKWSWLLLSDSIAIIILVVSCWGLLISGYWVPLVRPFLALIITSGGVLLFLSKFG